MKALIFTVFTLCSVLVCAAVSQPPVKSIEDKLAEELKKVTAAATELDRTKAGLKGHQDAKIRIQKLIDSCKQKQGACLDAPDALGVLEKALQKTEEQIELWQDSNAKASKEWSDSDARAKALQSQVNAKKVAEIDRAYTGINEKLTQQGMQTLNLKFDVATLGREIDRMEIGKYVAAKMALMLNSQAFCDSKVRCEEPKDKATKKVGSEQLKELFPGGGMDIFSNVDFWQESRNNRGADKNAATSGAK